MAEAIGLSASGQSLPQKSVTGFLATDESLAGHPNLNLNPEEKRIYSQLLKERSLSTGVVHNKKWIQQQ